MNKTFKDLKIIFLISTVALFSFAGIICAANSSSSIKIGHTTYPPGMGVSSIPPVICNVLASDPDGTNLFISFASAKRAGKTAFVNLNFNFSPDEYNNLMTGDTIDFQHGNNFANLIGQKVLFIFSEGSARKSRTKAVSISKGPPTTTDSSYLVMGSVKILNKRADGCLDVSFNATAQNASVNKVTTTIDPAMDCIEGTTSEKLRTVPSILISGNLYPEKFSGNSTNTSGSTSMLCNSTSVTSSGFTIPDFGNSSGFTIPDFGNSSGFTFPGFGTSGFTIPDTTDTSQ